MDPIPEQHASKMPVKQAVLITNRPVFVDNFGCRSDRRKWEQRSKIVRIYSSIYIKVTTK